MRRSFENTTGTASKFWHISTYLTGPQKGVSVHYGRIGSKGKGRTVHYPMDTAAAAKAFVHKKINEKLGRGYVEKGVGTRHGPIRANDPYNKTSPRSQPQNALNTRIRRVRKLFDQDYQKGIGFQSNDGWTDALRQRAKSDIPYYVEEHPDMEDGNIILMLVDDYFKYTHETQKRALKTRPVHPLHPRVTATLRRAYQTYNERHPDAPQTFEEWSQQFNIPAQYISDTVYKTQRRSTRNNDNTRNPVSRKKRTRIDAK